MEYDRFVGLVQNRARLATNGDAVAAIRATLTTLAERIDPGEADDLAAQLPREIAFYLKANPIAHGERFPLREFCHRVAEREYCDLPVAVFHARCVIEVMSEAVSPGEIRDVRSQLPAEFQALFEAGSMGRMRPRTGRGGYEREMSPGASERWSERRAEERRQSWHDEPEGGWRSAPMRGGGETSAWEGRESGFTGGEPERHEHTAGDEGGGHRSRSGRDSEQSHEGSPQQVRGRGSRERQTQSAGPDSMEEQSRARSSRSQGQEQGSRSRERASSRRGESESSERRTTPARAARH